MECADSETGVIFAAWLHDPNTPIEDICADCRFLPTKPGHEPEHLRYAIHRAAELDALKSSGATFPYPDALTPFEWTCLSALQTARTKSEAQMRRTDKADKDRQGDRTRLDQARRRRRRR
jgi:hypothetical protein